jgi:hypothetical protein
MTESKLCADARLTPEDLAKASVFSPRTASDLERGVHPTARKESNQDCPESI